MTTTTVDTCSSGALGYDGSGILEMSCGSGGGDTFGLPLTGLDLVLIVVGGLVLIGLGLLLRHFNRSNPDVEREL